MKSTKEDKKEEEKEEIEDVEVVDPVKSFDLKDMCNGTEYFWLMVIALLVSELLPFISDAFGVKIEGNGLFHIVIGLLTRNPQKIQEGISEITITEEV